MAFSNKEIVPVHSVIPEDDKVIKDSFNGIISDMINTNIRNVPVHSVISEDSKVDRQHIIQVYPEQEREDDPFDQPYVEQQILHDKNPELSASKVCCLWYRFIIAIITLLIILFYICFNVSHSTSLIGLISRNRKM